jgi:rhamnulokinase
VALGCIENGRLRMELLHRFANAGVPVGTSLDWDALGLWREMLDGLGRAAMRGPIASVGVTTWGVDYALLDPGGGLLNMPHHYRDRVARESYRPKSAACRASGSTS